MKLTEEQELILSAVNEFSEGTIAPKALDIERNGIPEEIISSLSRNGFMGAAIPDTLGGAGLGEGSYRLILESIAKYSPSLAFFIYIQNSVAAGLMMASERKGELTSAVYDIASGRKSSGISLDTVTSRVSEVTVSVDASARMTGKLGRVFNPTGDFVISPALKDGKEVLFVLDGGYRTETELTRLGFRGIGFSNIAIDALPGNFRMISEEKASLRLADVLFRSSGAVAAIALGMAEASIQKALDYANSRKAFNAKLIEFQPVAFSLSSMRSEIELLREYVLSDAANDELAGLKAKLMCTDLAVRASRLSLQVHGGNGYFDDYQIEKYYRDSMALQAFTGNRTEEMIRYSRRLFGNEAARL